MGNNEKCWKNHCNVNEAVATTTPSLNNEKMMHLIGAIGQFGVKDKQDVTVAFEI